MALKRVTAPADYPITLAEAKDHLRVDDTDSDTLITALIAAATDYVDGDGGFLGRAVIDQTWDLYFDKFNPDGFTIPLPPLIEVEGVYYIDAAGVEQTIDPSAYVVDIAKEPGRVTLNGGSWPSPKAVSNAVRIRFRAGFIDLSQSPPADDPPFAIKAALLMMVGDLYTHRETQVAGTVSQLPWAAEQLLRRYRISLSLA